MGDNLLGRNREIPDNLFHTTAYPATAVSVSQELVAAPGSRKSLYLTDVVISNGATAGRIKIVADSATAVTSILEYLYFAANGGMAKHFDPPIKIAENVNLGYSSVSVAEHSIMVSGFKAPDKI